MAILGIDIGGSGIKGAPVDTNTGTLLAERIRVETPQPATPEAVANGVVEIARHFKWEGSIGCGYPGVVKHGRTLSAANVDAGWINLEAEHLLTQKTGCRVTLINDADAAGLAEMRFGAGMNNPNPVMMLTIGTGIGAALFVNGHLVPNLELGHLIIRGKDAEDRASDRIRLEKELNWRQWAKRFNEYLAYLDLLFSPDLYILGGGVSKRFDKYKEFLQANAEIVPAKMLNEAGIIGAAMNAVEHETH